MMLKSYQIPLFGSHFVFSMQDWNMYWIWLYLIPAPRLALLVWRFKVDFLMKSTYGLLLVHLFLKLVLDCTTCSSPPGLGLVLGSSLDHDVCFGLTDG